MVQTLTPSATLSPDSWTAVGDSASHLTVDEGVDTHDANATYIRATTGGAKETRVGLSAGSDPGVHSGHVVRMAYRKKHTLGNPTTIIRVQLLQSGVAVTDKVAAPAAETTYSTFEYTLTTAEAASITDYSSLELSVLTTDASVTNLDARVTALELQLPDVVGAAVVWTLAEGASDAVAAALSAGMSAKLDALDTEYGDIVLPDVATYYRNPTAVDDVVSDFPAMAIYAASGSLPTLNDAGNVDGLFEIDVQVLVKDEDKTVLQKQVYRFSRAATEVLTEAWIAGTLNGWNLQADSMAVTYAPANESTEWTSGAVLRITMNKLESK